MAADNEETPDKPSTKKPSTTPKYGNSTAPADSADTGSPLPELDERSKPALPPRKSTLELMGGGQTSPSNSLRLPKKGRPHLQSTATTALSLAEAETQLYPESAQRTPSRSLRSRSSRMSLKVDSPSRRQRSYTNSDGDDNMSVRSYIPMSGGSADAESILGDLLLTEQRTPGWKFLNEHSDKEFERFEMPFDVVGEPTADFNREFDEIPDINPDGSNEGCFTRHANFKLNVSRPIT
jgi:vacuolar fusion protein MON1